MTDFCAYFIKFLKLQRGQQKGNKTQEAWALPAGMGRGWSGTGLGVTRWCLHSTRGWGDTQDLRSGGPTPNQECVSMTTPCPEDEVSQQLHQNSKGDPSYCPCATSPPQLGLLAASMQQLPAGPLCPFSTISSSATTFRGSISCHVPVHRLRYRLISPTPAPCRFEHTRSGLYLVTNHKHGYGGGNTRFCWLPNGKTSHWDIFVSRSPLQCEVPAKPWLNPFLCLLSKSCLPQLHSSPRLTAEIRAWFSVCPQLTNRYSTSAHLATKNGNLQPKL